MSLAEPNENMPPTVSEELDERKAHCAILEAWFKAHPLEEITPADLKALVGDNYQQRISELRKAPGPMHIENVPKWETRADGSKRKLSGSYRFHPQTPLGRSADVPLSRPVGGCGGYVTKAERQSSVVVVSWTDADAVRFMLYQTLRDDDGLLYLSLEDRAAAESILRRLEAAISAAEAPPVKTAQDYLAQAEAGQVGEVRQQKWKYGCARCHRPITGKPLTTHRDGMPARTDFFCSAKCVGEWLEGGGMTTCEPSKDRK